MRLVTKTYWGPRPFSIRPCVVFRFQSLAAAEQASLVDGHGAVARLLGERHGYVGPTEALAGWNGALAFLADASLFALNDVRGDLDESGHRIVNGQALLFVEFHQPELTVRAVKLMLSLAMATDADRKGAFDALLIRFWDQCHRAHPDFQAHALITAAKARKLHYANLGHKVWLYGMGSQAKSFFETSTTQDMASGVKTNKLAGKHLLQATGVPSAPYRIVRSRDELPAAIAAIGFPCVIKPVRGGAGRGVTANIKTNDEVDFAYAEADRQCNAGEGIMLEQHVPGRDHRLLFVRASSWPVLQAWRPTSSATACAASVS